MSTDNSFLSEVDRVRRADDRDRFLSPVLTVAQALKAILGDNLSTFTCHERLSDVEILERRIDMLERMVCKALAKEITTVSQLNSFIEFPTDRYDFEKVSE